MNDDKNKNDEFTVVSSLNDLGEDFVAQLLTPDGDPNEQGKGDDQKSTLSEEADDQAIAYYEVLKEQGLIAEPDDYKFDGTFQSLQQLSEYTYQQQYQLAQNQLMNSMPERLRDIVDAGLKGVDDIDQLLNLSKQININIDLEKEENQKALIREELSKTLPIDMLEEVLESYVDRGKLKDEAERILNTRKANITNQVEQMKLQAEQQKLYEQQQMQQFQTSLQNELNSQEWAGNRKKVVLNELTGTVQGVPIIEAKLQNILSNPKHVLVLADFLSYYDGQNFKLGEYKKVESQEAQNLKDSWASRLSGNAPRIKPKEQQNRGNLDLTDFELFVE